MAEIFFNMNTTTFKLKYVLFVSLISAMGGFLFGYDWVVIAGAKPFYESYFNITDRHAMQGWAMSSVLAGCILGSLLCFLLADKWGRKNSLILAAVLFIISAIGTGYANGLTSFIIYRSIGGLGIGLVSTLSPLYISEISPPKYRGRLVSINQLAIVIGILAAQTTNWCIAEPIAKGMNSDEILNSWNAQMGWRYMFWAEILPAIIFLISLFFIPKTPRFLLRLKRKEKAFTVLQKIGGTQYAVHQIEEVEQSLLEGGGKNISASELLSPPISPLLVFGILLAIFQQWCGINIIFNYADEVFEAAGYGHDDLLFNILITGSVNLIFTLVAIRTVDHWGRRKLMLFGAMGLAMIYAVLGGSFYFGFIGWPILILIIMGIAIYAMSLAPITWVILSEIFPNRFRGVAMSIATLSLWIASFLLTFTFPTLNEILGSYGTFWVYSAICLLGYLYIRKKLPETKAKSLEEIERIVNPKKEFP